MRIYYGADEKDMRIMFAIVTGQMSDGTLVYTECEQTEGKAVAMENGEPKLMLDRQYTRHLKRGMQTFVRI